MNDRPKADHAWAEMEDQAIRHMFRAMKIQKWLWRAVLAFWVLVLVALIAALVAVAGGV